MMYSEKEIMQFIEENDVKFIRLSFCDKEGRLKNISVMPNSLERIFIEGQLIEAEPLFGIDKKLRLVIDPSTLMAMPWRPSQGRVVRFYCDLVNLDGTHFRQDYRYFLRESSKNTALSLECKCPFYLFKTDENGYPTQNLWDKGGYFDVSPYDKGENIRRELCLSLDEMKIPVLASYHGENAGQNVIIIKAESLTEAADYIVALKFASQAIALRNGLYASFDSGLEPNNIIVTSKTNNKKIIFEANLNPYLELKRIKLG